MTSLRTRFSRIAVYGLCLIFTLAFAGVEAVYAQVGTDETFYLSMINNKTWEILCNTESMYRTLTKVNPYYELTAGDASHVWVTDDVNLVGILRGWRGVANPPTVPNYLRNYDRGLLYYIGATHDVASNALYRVSHVTGHRESVADILDDIRQKIDSDSDVNVNVLPMLSNLYLMVEEEFNDLQYTAGIMAMNTSNLVDKSSQYFPSFDSSLSNIVDKVTDISQSIKHEDETIGDMTFDIRESLKYEGEDGEETITDIAFDIREALTNKNEFVLGPVITNLAYMFALESRASMTNFQNFAELLAQPEGIPMKYTLNALYYNLIFGGLPLDEFVGQGNRNFKYPRYPNWRLFEIHQRNYYDAISTTPTVTNLIERASQRRYDAYNTYQTYYLISNLFASANFATFTNKYASADNFALDWFDSYNTKFQNLLLEYGTYATITNEDISSNLKKKFQYAKNWYDSYATLPLLQYFLNNDYLTGTNSLMQLGQGVSETVDDYGLQHMPSWGMSTNSLQSLDMGVIAENSNPGYKSEGDAIANETKSSAGYLNSGWDLIDTIEESFDSTIDTIISKISTGSDGEGVGSGSHNGLSLRIQLDNELVNIPEQYIDFSLPESAKTKLSGFWNLIKHCLEWGMWSWAFFACWGLLCDRDFKQSNPTILD